MSWALAQARTRTKQANLPLEPVGARVPSEVSEKIRLNRFLARAGIASRRKSDDLIASGVVRVNGETVDTPGVVIDPNHDRIEVRGQLVNLPESFHYLLLNKPAGLLVTRSDERGRATVFEHISGLRPGIVAVGRLDRDTTGVLLLTDDGELAHRLMHPCYGIDKVYHANIKGVPSPTLLRRLRRGIELEDGMTAPAQAQLVTDDKHDPEPILQIRIREGRKRQVRRMCQAIGHPVKALHRIEFAGLTSKRLRPGESRHLKPSEVANLLKLVNLSR